MEYGAAAQSSFIRRRCRYTFWSIVLTSIVVFVWLDATDRDLEHTPMNDESTKKKAASLLASGKSKTISETKPDTFGSHEAQIFDKGVQSLTNNANQDMPAATSGTSPLILDALEAEKKDSTGTALQILVAKRFPTCAAYFNSNITSIRYASVFRYIPSNDPPRYDYLSCFAMKPRYNCETGDPRRVNSTNDTRKAINYKLVLRSTDGDASNDHCDLRALVDFFGGPKGISQYLSHNIPAETRRATNIVMIGNSYFRQIMESFACGWKDQLTENRYQVGGPTLNLKTVSEKKNLTSQNIGTLVKLDVDNETCHSIHVEGELTKFYPDGLLPLVLPNTTLVSDCNDDINLLEFGESNGKGSKQQSHDQQQYGLRFIFIFWPFTRNNMSHYILDQLGIEGSQIDYLLFNYGLQRSWRPPKGIRDHVWDQQLVTEPLLNALRKAQERDIGRWFGANNRWITDPPDVHPCMPGVPDDEANLLLFMLLSNTTSLE